MPLGYKTKRRIQKEASYESYRKAILAKLDPLTDSQLMTALGAHEIFAKTSTGEWVKVTDGQDILRLLNTGPEFYKIVQRPPDVQMSKYLTDQVFGRPVERVAVSGPDGGPLHVVWHDRDPDSP